ncbi:MAG: flagellar biosynthetic protein FliO [Planctomycetaceae bacterium]|nr:flagellar biosynthetic protein FliO [Planctomycetaceae bacterium]
MLAAVISVLVLASMCLNGQNSTVAASTPASQPVPASAASAAASPPPSLPLRSEGTPLIFKKDEGNMLWRMVASLVVVGVLAAGAVLMARRNMLQRLTGGRKGTLGVLEASRLGPRAMMYLVKAGKKKYLLAASREQVTFLAEVTEAYDDEPTPA